MKAYQSTAAQARFADSLAAQVGDEVFAEIFAKATRFNGNKPYIPGGAETRIKAMRRTSKKVASQIIDELLAVKNA